MNIRMSILQQPYKHYIFKSFSCQSDRMAYYFIFVFNVYLKELMTVSLFHRVGQWKLVNCLILVLTQSMLLCCPWLSMTVSCPKWICLIWAAPSKYWSLGLCLALPWLSPQPASSSDLPCARRLLMSPLDTTSAEDAWYPHIMCCSGASLSFPCLHLSNFHSPAAASSSPTSFWEWFLSPLNTWCKWLNHLFNKTKCQVMA